MTTQVLTGLLLLVLPVAYNLFFTLLARGFDYPDILRQPTGEILRRFQAGEVPVFWACGVTPQSVAANAKPPLFISHPPGAMLVTNLLNSQLSIL